MTLDEYQITVDKELEYPKKGKNIFYPALVLSGQVGDISSHVGKIMLENMGRPEDKDLDEMKNKIGGVLMTLALLASEFGISLEEAMALNLTKLVEKKKTDV